MVQKSIDCVRKVLHKAELNYITNEKNGNNNGLMKTPYFQTHKIENLINQQ